MCLNVFTSVNEERSNWGEGRPWDDSSSVSVFHPVLPDLCRIRALRAQSVLITLSARRASSSPRWNWEEESRRERRRPGEYQPGGWSSALHSLDQHPSLHCGERKVWLCIKNCFWHLVLYEFVPVSLVLRHNLGVSFGILAWLFGESSASPVYSISLRNNWEETAVQSKSGANLYFLSGNKFWSETGYKE